MLLSRHHRRSRKDREERRAAWDPASILIPEQLAAHNDNANLRIIDGSRRCGKSFWAAVELIDNALLYAGSRSLFLALTRTDAKELVWEEILRLNREYALSGIPNEVRLEIIFSNGSVIRCGGAKDRRQAERWRGRFYSLVVIDECQLFPSHLRELVENILKPSLLGRGRRGRLVLMGTPAEVAGIGYWEEKVCDKAWSLHRWTLRANFHLGTPEDIQAFLDEKATEYGGGNLEAGRCSPSYLREYCGERPAANDNDRPFTYDYKINDFEAYPGAVKRIEEHWIRREGRRVVSFTRWALPLGGKWRFTFGIDLGSRAASAIIVLGTTDVAPGKIWLIEEFLSTRMLPDKLRDKIDERRRYYSPNLMAVDEGALGDMIADQWRAPPYCLSVVAAEKTAPEVTADFLSASMARGDFFLCKESRTAEDMAVLRWDEEYLLNRGKRRVAVEPHSDAVPACRYAFKDAYALATSIRAPKPVNNSIDAELAAELKQEQREAAKRKKGFIRGLSRMRD